ncbi:MAG TPA: hypothetical protein VGB60_09550 [Brevundimonas sp.]|jgi:hypothetical protein|uniref:hypothetical protein n=1 Tax=Brevundimonas sp. TaxID=1871086 RepID=UPI002EDB72D7
MTDQPSPWSEPSRNLDPRATEFTDARFSLFDLYRASVLAGGGVMIEGRSFNNCVIEGPAVMLVLEGVHFESTNFGPTGGNLRNMLFKPMGDMGIGGIPIRNCTFTGCQFQTLGITGNDSLLEMLIEQVPVG